VVPAPLSAARVPSAGVEDVDDEDERRAAGDGVARALVAVAELRRDDEEDLAADGLADDAGVPALDELPGPGLERQRVAELPRGVEHRPVPQPAGVVGVDVVALLDRLAGALDD